MMPKMQQKLEQGMRDATKTGFGYADRLAFIKIQRTHTYHPSVAFTNSSVFLLILELHPDLSTSQQWPLFRNIGCHVFGADTTTNMRLKEAFPYEKVVNEEFLVDLAPNVAREVLADIVRTVQSHPDLAMEVLVGHHDGYTGQRFDINGYSIIEVTRSKSHSSLVSLDAAVDSTIQESNVDQARVSRAEVVAGYTLNSIPWDMQPTIKVKYVSRRLTHCFLDFIHMARSGKHPRHQVQASTIVLISSMPPES